MNLFARVPQWLRGALGTTQPDLPNLLDTAAVMPVIDIAQHGWGMGTWAVQTVNQPADTAGQARFLIEPNDLLTRRILGLHLSHAGGAAALVELRLDSPVTGTRVRLGQWSIDPGGFIRWTDGTDNAGSVRSLSSIPTVVPPGWGFSILFPNTAVGETFLAVAAIGTIEAGLYLPV